MQVTPTLSHSTGIIAIIIEYRSLNWETVIELDIAVSKKRLGKKQLFLALVFLTVFPRDAFRCSATERFAITKNRLLKRCRRCAFDRDGGIRFCRLERDGRCECGRIRVGVAKVCISNKLCLLYIGIFYTIEFKAFYVLSFALFFVSGALS